MKITIIGGGGRVGSCAAFALQCAGLVAEIQILDANKDMADGEALDLLHGSAFAGDQRIYAGDYARAADSDMFLITAGLRRKPDESRLDLINRNVSLFVQILESIKSAGLRKDAHVLRRDHSASEDRRVGGMAGSGGRRDGDGADDPRHGAIASGSAVALCVRSRGHDDVSNACAACLPS